MCFEACESRVPWRTADQLLVRLDTGFMERALVASQSCLGGGVAHIPKDVRDATVAELDQVASGQPGALGIIVGHRGIRRTAQLPAARCKHRARRIRDTVSSKLSVWGESCTNRRASPSTLPLLSILRNGAGSSPIASGNMSR